MRSALVRLSTVLLVAAALSCADAATGPGTFLKAPIATYATVRFVGIEGGCWSLDTPQGHYQPIDLPAEFQVDGLAVAVSLRPAPDMLSFCMMGPLAWVDDIRAR